MAILFYFHFIVLPSDIYIYIFLHGSFLPCDVFFLHFPLLPYDFVLFFFLTFHFLPMIFRKKDSLTLMVMGSIAKTPSPRFFFFFSNHFSWFPSLFFSSLSIPCVFRHENRRPTCFLNLINLEENEIVKDERNVFSSRKSKL